MLSMMKTKIYSLFALGLGLLTMTSCSDFLDKVPDERTELLSEDNIVDLLKGSYPGTNYQYVCELSSDNLIDNNSPHLPSGPWDEQIESHYNYASSSRWTDEMFRFEQAKSATIYDGESPGRIWSQWFNSIGSVNAALEAIDNLARKQGINRDVLISGSQGFLLNGVRNLLPFLALGTRREAHQDHKGKQENYS